MAPLNFDRLTCYCYSQILAQRRGILLHAAAVERRGSVFLFFAPSEGGKSTIAGLSQKYKVLADDVVAVRNINEKYYAIPTPWRQSGFVMTDPKSMAKIKGAFFLKKSDRISFKDMAPQKALAEILTRQVHFFEYLEKTLVEKIFFTASDFVRAVPAYEMNFTATGDFWPRLEERVHGGRQ